MLIILSHKALYQGLYLFILYVNDLLVDFPENIKYADDAAVTSTAQNME